MSNKIIFNLTIKIENAVETEWLNDLTKDYLPMLVDGKIICDAQVNKLILEQAEDDSTFALQFTYLSDAIFKLQKLNSMEKLLNAMDSKYKGRYVYFATKMERIHFQSNPLQSSEISLN